VIHVVFDGGICPLVTLLVPCVCWSERRSLRPTVVDNNLLFMEVRACKLLNKTVHRNSSLRFAIFYGCCQTCEKLVSAISILNIFYNNHNMYKTLLVAWLPLSTMATPVKCFL
jgi:hypothetical protein